jgi:hypothetical protein
MSSRKSSVAAVMLAAALSIECGVVGAQSIEAQAKIRAAIVQSTAAPEKSIEITFKSGGLTILIVNSSRNGSTHQGYTDDAQAAVQATVVAVKDDPDFAKLNSVRVKYIERSVSPPRDKILDSVEFRKNSTGTFILHVS